MRNTSESPDANEQAKATPARSRTGTRSKSEQASPVSQEQEVKKAPVSPSSARRGSSTSTTPPARIQATGDHKPAAAARSGRPQGAKTGDQPQKIRGRPQRKKGGGRPQGYAPTSRCSCDINTNPTTSSCPAPGWGRSSAANRPSR